MFNFLKRKRGKTLELQGLESNVNEINANETEDLSAVEAYSDGAIESCGDTEKSRNDAIEESCGDLEESYENEGGSYGKSDCLGSKDLDQLFELENNQETATDFTSESDQDSNQDFTSESDAGETPDFTTEKSENEYDEAPEGIKEMMPFLKDDSYDEKQDSDTDSFGIDDLFDDIINGNDTEDLEQEQGDNPVLDEEQNLEPEPEQNLEQGPEPEQEPESEQNSYLRKPVFNDDEKVAIEFMSLENIDLNKYQKINCEIHDKAVIAKDKGQFVFDGSVKFCIIFDDKISADVLLEDAYTNELSKGCYNGFNVQLNLVEEGTIAKLDCYKSFNYSYSKEDVLIVQIIFTL